MEVMERESQLAHDDCILLIRAAQSRDVATMVQAILAVDQIVFYMKNILLASPSSPMSTGSTIPSVTIDSLSPDQERFSGSPECPLNAPCSADADQDSDPNPYNLHSLSGAIDLSVKKHSELQYKQHPAFKKEMSLDFIQMMLPSARESTPNGQILQLDGEEVFADIQISPMNLSTIGSRHTLNTEGLQPDIINRRHSHDSGADSVKNAPKHKELVTKSGGHCSSTNLSDPNHIFPSKRPMKCHICSKIVRADNFQVHIRSHTGEKPYKCPLCPFRSANPSSMPKHLRLHDKGREIYKCQKCSYSTIYKSNFAVHKRTHHSKYNSHTSKVMKSTYFNRNFVQNTIHKDDRLANTNLPSTNIQPMAVYDLQGTTDLKTKEFLQTSSEDLIIANNSSVMNLNYMRVKSPNS